MPVRDIFIEATYLAASVMFILGLRSLTRPEFARRGMQQAAIGMVLAIVGTLLKHEIVEYQWIIAGLALGTLIGYPLGMFVPMTAMPQRIAISHMFGAVAATLVGVATYYNSGGVLGHAEMTALGFEVMFGSLTITGSLMATLKLQGVHARPADHVPRDRTQSTSRSSRCTFGIFIYLIARPDQTMFFYGMIAMGLVIGMSMVLPIGGADMPVVVSLLNSYAGLASAATGFAIGNNVLIIAGALDGAPSGFLLSILMSKAMNQVVLERVVRRLRQRREDDQDGGRPDGSIVHTGLGGGRGASPRLCRARDHRPRVRHGGRPVAARCPRVGGADRASRWGRRSTRYIPVAGRMRTRMNVLLAEAKQRPV